MIAVERGVVVPHHVFDEPTLRAIAAAWPATQNGLEQVDGVSIYKAKRYGRSLLDWLLDNDELAGQSSRQGRQNQETGGDGGENSKEVVNLAGRPENRHELNLLADLDAECQSVIVS